MYRRYRYRPSISSSSRQQQGADSELRWLVACQMNARCTVRTGIAMMRTIWTPGTRARQNGRYGTTTTWPHRQTDGAGQADRHEGATPTTATSRMGVERQPIFPRNCADERRGQPAAEARAPQQPAHGRATEARRGNSTFPRVHAWMRVWAPLPTPRLTMTRLRQEPLHRWCTGATAPLMLQTPPTRRHTRGGWK